MPDPAPVVVATGVGSLPGTDVREAAAVVAGELPELPHLAELPARGPGADLTGRGLGVLVDLHADLQPAGWRLVPRPGREVRRARDFLQADLDELEEALATTAPATVKTQLAGPWTLVATTELPRGDKVMSDRGAVRDLAGALAQGAADHVARLRRGVPGARVVLQLDEPALPMVLAGRVRTASGFGILRRPEPREVSEHLATVIAAAGADETWVHCCADDPPLALLRGAGATGVSLDAARRHDSDALGEWLDTGGRLALGLLPSLRVDRVPTTPDVVRAAQQLWHRIGPGPERMAGQLVITPSCGLAGADPDWTRTAYALARDAARALTEAPA